MVEKRGKSNSILFKHLAELLHRLKCMIKRNLFLAILVTLSIALSAGVSVPPSAFVKPDTLVIHDKVLIDDYTWLKDTESREVKSYLKQEQKYASDYSRV